MVINHLLIGMILQVDTPNPPVIPGEDRCEFGTPKSLLLRRYDDMTGGSFTPIPTFGGPGCLGKPQTLRGLLLKLIVFRPHRIHVWYIYLHLVIFMVNVGKYTIHGSYGVLGFGGGSTTG